jgi:RNA polymerase sigma factor (sigma-70 family)
MKAVALDAALASAPIAAVADGSDDVRLVRECLDGRNEAWSALIDKYKRLVYSIPVKYGMSPDEASEIFQDTCLELLAELPQLREPRALPKWLMQVAARKCVRAIERDRRRAAHVDDAGESVRETAAPGLGSDEILLEVEREQALRDAVAALPPRCGRLVRMLFYETPARPYREIAEALAIARGSIGFIRGRCLRRLRIELQSNGFC